MSSGPKSLLEKIQALSPDRIAQVEDFVDYIRNREFEAGLSEASTTLSEETLAAIWNHDEDSAYDEL